MVSNFNILNVPKIFFGIDSIENLRNILKQFIEPTILLITGSGKIFKNKHAEKLIEIIHNLSLKVYNEKISAEPTIDDVDTIVSKYQEEKIDLVLGFGGGSALDAAKAISAMLPLKTSIFEYLEGVGNKKHPGIKIKYIAIPTTSGTGSEATNNAVIMKSGENGFKKSLRHENFIPDIAIVDPLFTTTLSTETTIISGLDALSQLLESYTSTKSNIYVCSLIENAIVKMIKGLEIIIKDPENIEIRSNLSYGALISGISLTNAGLGLVHGLASPLGHTTLAPHGLICGNLIGPVNKLIINKLRNNYSNETLKKYITIAKKLYNLYNDNEALNKLEEYFESIQEKFKLNSLKKYLKDNKSIIEKLSKEYDQKNSPVNFTSEEVYKILEEAFR